MFFGVASAPPNYEEGHDLPDTLVRHYHDSRVGYAFMDSIVDYKA